MTASERAKLLKSQPVEKKDPFLYGDSELEAAVRKSMPGKTKTGAKEAVKALYDNAAIVHDRRPKL